MDSLHLIQNSFSTILLDAIQYFPENTNEHAESHGILFGIEKEGFIECDYVFPVGNVQERMSDSVTSNLKIDAAIQNAKQLLSTSKFVGTYHSHPYQGGYFKEWACPSNGDCSYARTTKFPFELIVGLARNGNRNQPLNIEYKLAEGMKFLEKRGGDHDWPKEESLGVKVQYITGEFNKYKFEIRAYENIGSGFKAINLFSSEAEMLMRLVEKEVNISTLSSESSYSLRKIEYNLRMTNQKSNERSDRAMQNLDYHLNKIKNSMGN